MRPARRILSISPGDLQTIAILYCLDQFRCYTICLLPAINLLQATLRAIVVRQRKRLPLVFFQALANNIFSIIRARNELRAVDITGVGDAWRLKMNVVDPPAGGTRTTSGKPLQ